MKTLKYLIWLQYIYKRGAYFEFIRLFFGVLYELRNYSLSSTFNQSKYIRRAVHIKDTSTRVSVWNFPKTFILNKLHSIIRTVSISHTQTHINRHNSCITGQHKHTRSPRHMVVFALAAVSASLNYCDSTAEAKDDNCHLTLRSWKRDTSQSRKY